MYILLKDNVVVGTATSEIDAEHLRDQQLIQIYDEFDVAKLNDVYINNAFVTLTQWQKFDGTKISYDMEKHKAYELKRIKDTAQQSILEVFPDVEAGAKIREKQNELVELLNNSNTEADIDDIEDMLDELKV